MTATPTDAERDMAAVIVGSMSDRVLGQLLKADIAQALADQRARYEAVADELEGWQANLDDDPTWVAGYLDGIAAGTRRIRSVAR